MTTQTAGVAASIDVPDLETLWYESDPQRLRCLVCKNPFTQSAVIRTFRVGQVAGRSRQSLGCSSVITTHLNKDIILYDRHLHCLLEQGIAFIAVSHVWDPIVALSQTQNRFSPQLVGVRRLAVEAPICIYDGLMRDKRDKEGEELWHDYFSIPQWTSGLKRHILSTIHTIFSSAATTLFYFHDVTTDLVQKLQYGKTSEERLQGMTGVCNSQWFGRMWTAMEFVRSGNVQMMTADYQPVGETADPMFLKRLQEVWDEELKKHQSVYDLERKIDLGRNVVPWNLGPLAEIKTLKSRNFAMAFALLSKRRCRDQNDFLYALSGIVTTGPRKPFQRDFQSVIELVRRCIEAGDYSPLLIMPDLGSQDPRAHPDYVLRAGYNDVLTWELGEQINRPDCAFAPSFDADSRTVTLGLEKMGVVTFVQRVNDRKGGTGDAMRGFARCASLALKLTGPNLHDFIGSLGTRLYGANQDYIMGTLKATNNVYAVEKALYTRLGNPELRCGSWPIEGPEGAKWLANVLTLSTSISDEPETRLASSLGLYNAIHCRGFNYIVGIKCSSCCRTSPFRVSGFCISSADLHSANAYRIPGLQYRLSIPNGIALLEKSGKIVGRMIWATPACMCRNPELQVRLDIPDLPPLRPRSAFYSTADHPTSELYFDELRQADHDYDLGHARSRVAPFGNLNDSR